MDGAVLLAVGLFLARGLAVGVHRLERLPGDEGLGDGVGQGAALADDGPLVPQVHARRVGGERRNSLDGLQVALGRGVGAVALGARLEIVGVGGRVVERVAHQHEIRHHETILGHHRLAGAECAQQAVEVQADLGGAVVQVELGHVGGVAVADVVGAGRVGRRDGRAGLIHELHIAKVVVGDPVVGAGGLIAAAVVLLDGRAIEAHGDGVLRRAHVVALEILLLMGAHDGVVGGLDGAHRSAVELGVETLVAHRHGAIGVGGALQLVADAAHDQLAHHPGVALHVARIGIPVDGAGQREVHHLVSDQKRQLHGQDVCQVHGLAHAGPVDGLGLEHDAVVLHGAGIAGLVGHLGGGGGAEIRQGLHQVQHAQVRQRFADHGSLKTHWQVGVADGRGAAGQQFALVVDALGVQAVEVAQHLLDKGGYLLRQAQAAVGMQRRAAQAGEDLLLQGLGILALAHGDMDVALGALPAHGGELRGDSHLVAQLDLMLGQALDLVLAHLRADQLSGLAQLLAGVLGQVFQPFRVVQQLVEQGHVGLAPLGELSALRLGGLRLLSHQAFDVVLAEAAVAGRRQVQVGEIQRDGLLAGGLRHLLGEFHAGGLQCGVERLQRLLVIAQLLAGGLELAAELIHQVRGELFLLQGGAQFFQKFFHGLDLLLE